MKLKNYLHSPCAKEETTHVRMTRTIEKSVPIEKGPGPGFPIDNFSVFHFFFAFFSHRTTHNHTSAKTASKPAPRTAPSTPAATQEEAPGPPTTRARAPWDAATQAPPTRSRA